MRKIFLCWIIASFILISAANSAPLLETSNVITVGDSYCGNGVCENGESCSNCPEDCGKCRTQSSGGGISGTFCNSDYTCTAWSECNSSNLQHRTCIGPCSFITTQQCSYTAPVEPVLPEEPPEQVVDIPEDVVVSVPTINVSDETDVADMPESGWIKKHPLQLTIIILCFLIITYTYIRKRLKPKNPHEKMLAELKAYFRMCLRKGFSMADIITKCKNVGHSDEDIKKAISSLNITVK